MASAQVLPNSSRKQEHLEAGKRRLEEFRKKKAADRAKKTSSTSQLHAVDISLNEKRPLDIDRVRITDSDGVGTSDGIGGAVIEPSSVVINDDKMATEFAQISDAGFLKNAHAKPIFSASDYNGSSPDALQTHAREQEFTQFDTSGSGFPGPVNLNYGEHRKEKNDDFGIYTGSQGPAHGITADLSIALRPRTIQDIDSNSSQSSYYGAEEFQPKENYGSLEDFSVPYSNTSKVPLANVSSEKYGSILPQNKLTDSAREVGQHMHGNVESNGPMISDTWERNPNSYVGNFSTVHNVNSDFRISSNYVPLYSTPAESNIRRSRPSFLDSLNMSRPSSASPFSVTESEKPVSFLSNNSKIHSMDVLSSSASQKPFPETLEPFSALRTPNLPSALENSINSSVSSHNGIDQPGQRLNEYGMERKNEFHSSKKQDEDFAALEQHIEDLTQEKFSLQRALEASRALAESLAAENSTLTDSFNQQGSFVNQLRSDMEKLQEEIKAQLVELETIKIEYANAQLECNAADERGKLLASEVIGLEEKALKLRSSELKLEKQLENSHAEITSYKKKTSSLERERQDLQLTIDALQEEKKLLQSKLRKSSGSGKSVDISRIPSNKKDMSTSTEDLDCTVENSNLELHNSESFSTSNFCNLLPENEFLNFDTSSVNIPSDQMKVIQNINALISELALEKEEIMQALAAKSSHNSKLKELNKELSRKLEAQTQRLELLTSRSMANENIPVRQPDSRTMYENAAYVDEGDEVVERVLGWIMKLFPGGPSKRRTSKLI